MTELTDLCQAVIELENSDDKTGLDLTISDLRAFLKDIDNS